MYTASEFRIQIQEWQQKEIQKVSISIAPSAGLSAFQEIVEIIHDGNMDPVLRLPTDTKISGITLKSQLQSSVEQWMTPKKGPLTEEQRQEGILTYEDVLQTSLDYTSRDQTPAFQFYIELHSISDVYKVLKEVRESGHDEVSLKIVSADKIMSELISEMLSTNPNPNIQYSNVVFGGTKDRDSAEEEE